MRRRKDNFHVIVWTTLGVAALLCLYAISREYFQTDFSGHAPTLTKIIVVIAIGLLLSPVYMLPTIVATKRKHHNLQAITVANALFGVTGLGWCLCLVWAYTSPRPN